MQVDKNRIIFYTFSDKANQFMIKYSVPAFYFTIILTLANFLKVTAVGRQRE